MKNKDIHNTGCSVAAQSIEVEMPVDEKKM